MEQTEKEESLKEIRAGHRKLGDGGIRTHRKYRMWRRKQPQNQMHKKSPVHDGRSQ